MKHARHPRKKAHHRRPRRTVLDAVADLLEVNQHRYKRPTLERISRCLLTFARLVKVTPRKFDQAALERFIHTRLQEGVAASTVNLEVRYLRYALTRIGEGHAFTHHKRLPERIAGIVLTPEQEAQLLFEIKMPNTTRAHELSRAAALVLQTGLRSGELRSLAWTDVDLQHEVLTVQRGKTARARRSVPLNQRALDLLHAQSDFRDFRAGADPDQFVFAEIRSTDLTNHRAWLAARQKIGLPTLRFHDLRHTVATRLLIQGTPTPIVLAILGHVHESVLRVYAHVNLPTARAALEAQSVHQPPIAAPIGAPIAAPIASKVQPPAANLKEGEIDTWSEIPV